jgi:class 3 adenylate cyclase
MRTRNLTIMLTDIKGFTARTSESTREGVSKLISEHERLLVPVFRHLEGTVVKTIGDAFLVTFESPTDAVLCGLAIQEVLRQHNAFVDDKNRLDVRVAINVGDVELRDGDVLGEPVNLCARLEAITDPGEVFFTEAVYLSMNRKEVPSAEVGERVFKGIPHPIRVYRVIRDPNSDQARRIADAVRLTQAGPVIRGLKEPARRKRTALVTVTVAAAAAALLGGLALTLGPSEADRALADAGRLTADRQHRAAIETLEPHILRNPADDRLRNAALHAAEGYLEAISREQGLDAALDWMRKTVEAKPYLERLRRRAPVLEMRHVCEQILEGKLRAHGRDWALHIREVLKRYDQEAEICFLAAEMMQKRFIVEATLYLYDEAIRRGADPKDRRIFDACVRTLETNTPADAKAAHELLRAHFQTERVAWARGALDAGPESSPRDENYDRLSLWILNSAHILREAGDGRIDEPYYAALADLAARRRIHEACEVLAAEADPARGRRALALAERALDLHEAGRVKLPMVAVEPLREAFARLREKWAGP